MKTRTARLPDGFYEEVAPGVVVNRDRKAYTAMASKRKVERDVEELKSMLARALGQIEELKNR